MAEGIERLKAKALGKWTLAWAGVAFFTPGAGAAVCIGPVIYFTGVLTLVTMVLSGIMILIVAYSMAQFTRKLPSAGSFYTFAIHAVGFRVGWVVAGLSFTMWALLSAGATGVGYWFLWWGLAECGVHIPWWIIFVIGFAFVAFLAWIGVEASFKFLIYSAWLQIVCVLALSAYVMTIGPFHGGAMEGTSLLPLMGKLEGLKGISGAAYGLLWGTVVFVGFEAVAAMGEETKDPLKAVGFGLVVSIIIGTIFYIIYTTMTIYGFWNGMRGWTLEEPVIVMLGKEFWGLPGFVLFIGIVTLGTIGPASAGMMGVARIVYSMGRAGILPRVFGRLHSRFRTPWAAILAVYVFGLIAMIPGSVLWGGDTGPLQWCVAVGVITAMAAALACYGIACVCSIFYYRRKHPGEFNTWKHGVVPGLGASLIVFVLVGMFFPPHIPEIFDITAVLIIALCFFVSGTRLQRTRSKEELERTGAIMAGLVDEE